MRICWASGVMPVDFLVIFLGRLLHEIMQQQRDIFPPIPQRRNDDRDPVDPEEQILPELLLGNHLVKLLVGGANEPYVNPDRLIGPKPHDLAILQNAQQFRLHGGGHVADLVEEERPTVGMLEAPFAIRLGPGERALHVPEQFIFQNALAQPGAIQGDQPLLATTAVVVDGPGDQLLPGPAFAHDEDGNVTGGNLPGGLHHLLHARRAADDPFEALHDRRPAAGGSGFA